MARWGLRWKSILALSITALIVSIMALLVGWLVISEGRGYSARTYATNFTELNYQKILTPVRREVALAQQFAQLSSTQEWMSEPQATLSSSFRNDVIHFRQAFSGGTVFFATDRSHNYYYYDEQLPIDNRPRYGLSATDPTNKWYFQFKQSGKDLDINVDFSEQLKVTKIWINVAVHSGGEFLGIAGTGFEFDEFVAQFAHSPEAGVQPFIVDGTTGAIRVHPKRELIAFDAFNNHNEGGSIYSMVTDPNSIRVVESVIEQSKRTGEIAVAQVNLEHSEQLLAVRYLPELDWLVMTSVNLDEVRLLNTDMLMGIGALFAVLIFVVLILVAVLVERLVIRPIRSLQQSANAIARGAYDVRIPEQTHDDEVADLSRAFNKMAEQVEQHTHTLEAKVKARTQALEQSNRLVQEANRKLGDSIDYASLIQQAILPDRVMRQRLGRGYGLMWRPRDVVGGDFYVFNEHEDGYLVGIIDCAGHGVPGALMTMLLRAAVDHAVNDIGVQNPAKLLEHIDQTVRNMLNEAMISTRVATNADAGLVFVPKHGDFVRFAGAKIPLYRVMDGAVERIKAGRRAIADSKVGEFENIDVDARHATFCLTTDGFLDQSGGEKSFGFGNKRFEQLLLDTMNDSPEQQIQTLESALSEYMGDTPQRDDITLFMFRTDESWRAE